jgi:hypothetical protein
MNTRPNPLPPSSNSGTTAQQRQNSSSGESIAAPESIIAEDVRKLLDRGRLDPDASQNLTRSLSLSHEEDETLYDMAVWVSSWLKNATVRNKQGQEKGVAAPEDAIHHSRDLRPIRDLLIPLAKTGSMPKSLSTTDIGKKLDELRTLLQNHPYLGHNIPQELLDLLVYVIHTEAAACLGNHVLRFSRFSHQEREGWVANITLRSWRVTYRGPGPGKKKREPIGTAPSSNPTKGVPSTTPTASDKASQQKSKSKLDRGSYKYNDDEPIFMPEELRKVWGGSRMETQERLPLDVLSFELDISSVCLSTNPFGDFSKCLIVSELISDDDLCKIARKAREVWNKFVHQPQTARCLVFLLVLGHLCQRITENYAIAMKELTPILELNVSLNSPMVGQTREAFPELGETKTSTEHYQAS